MVVGDALQVGDDEDLPLALRHARLRGAALEVTDAVAREEGEVAREPQPAPLGVRDGEAGAREGGLALRTGQEG